MTTKMKLALLTRWIVLFGKSQRIYYTAYHARQFAEALRMNGTPYELIEAEVTR